MLTFSFNLFCIVFGFDIRLAARLGESNVRIGIQLELGHFVLNGGKIGIEHFERNSIQLGIEFLLQVGVEWMIRLFQAEGIVPLSLQTPTARTRQRARSYTLRNKQ